MRKEDLILINILINIWEKKILIILTSLMFVIITYALLNITKKPVQYNISTNIKPLSFKKENKFTVFNEFIKMSMTNDIFNNFVLNTNKKNFEITNELLYKMFIDNLENKKIIIDAIKNLNIIDKNKYGDLSSFNFAVQELANSISIYNPDKKNSTNNNKMQIRVKYHDFAKWENLLNSLQKEINNKVREVLIDQFEAYTDNLVKLNQYLVNDLEQQISFYETKFRSIKRNNLTYLYGHAQVAREMDIKNITKDINLIVENFDPGIDDVKLMLDYKNPRYYLMGYEFIERRIDLIEKSLESNKLISNDAVILENNKKLFLNREIIETINDLFNKSPLTNPKEFSAAYFDIKNSNISIIKDRFSDNKILLFAFILGTLFSVLFVLVSKNLSNYLKYFAKELKNKQRKIN